MNLIICIHIQKDTLAFRQENDAWTDVYTYTSTYTHNHSLNNAHTTSQYKMSTSKYKPRYFLQPVSVTPTAIPYVLYNKTSDKKKTRSHYCHLCIWKIVLRLRCWTPTTPLELKLNVHKSLKKSASLQFSFTTLLWIKLNEIFL